MSKKFVLCLVAAFGLLIGCDDDAKPFEPSSQTRCNAAYVVENNGRVCYLGDCPRYNADLHNRYCPSEAPLCIKDDNGYFYCGTNCPVGMDRVLDAPEFASMCKKDSIDTDPPKPHDVCSVSDCLAAKGHENWANAKCSNDGSCIVTECLDGYALYNNNCLPSLQCCGDKCINCPDRNGWQHGACIDGKCVADDCMDGYVLSTQNDGSVLCELKINEACSNDLDCPASQVCDIETGTCVCDKGLALCDGGCYDLLYDDENCGVCNNICKKPENGVGYCDKALCRMKCNDGYIVSEDGVRCVKDWGKCSDIGESYCEHDISYDVMTILKCNNDYRWSAEKTCIMTDHVVRLTCSKLDCEVFCSDKYIQSEDGASCESKADPCIDGEYRCNVTNLLDEQYYHCNHNKWELEKVCIRENTRKMSCSNNSGCDIECLDGYTLNPEGNECLLDAQTTCTDGRTRCNNMEFQRCENGHWTLIEACHIQGYHGGAMSCDQTEGCQPKCSNEYVLCGMECADFQNDYDHCGSCDNVCESGKCINGVCQ